jgi:hypothetical protein
VCILVGLSGSSEGQEPRGRSGVWLVGVGITHTIRNKGTWREPSSHFMIFVTLLGTRTITRGFCPGCFAILRSCAIPSWCVVGCDVDYRSRKKQIDSIPPGVRRCGKTLDTQKEPENKRGAHALPSSQIHDPV